MFDYIIQPLSADEIQSGSEPFSEQIKKAIYVLIRRAFDDEWPLHPTFTLWFGICWGQGPFDCDVALAHINPQILLRDRFFRRYTACQFWELDPKTYGELVIAIGADKSLNLQSDRKGA